MKKCFAASAILLGLAAQAATTTMFYMTDVGGGSIRFTSQRSPICPPNYGVAYSVQPNADGEVLSGCWRFLDDIAHVTWWSGDEKTYKLKDVKPTAFGQSEIRKLPPRKN